VTAGHLFAWGGWIVAIMYAVLWLRADRRLREVRRRLFEFQGRQASPHYLLSELLASAERMKTARLGETGHFSRPASHFTARPSLDPVDLRETGYLITKDVP
jgi:hypothetical protein